MTLPASVTPPSCFPDDVLCTASPDRASWFAVRTKTRQEKALAHELKARSIAYYLPLFEKRQKSRERIRHSQWPLFGGYLFMRGTPDEKHGAWETQRVVQILHVSNQARFVTELNAVATAMRHRAVRLARYHHLGARVRVVRGPLAGLEGIVERRNGNHRLRLSVEAIRLAIRVEIGVDEIEPLRV